MIKSFLMQKNKFMHSYVYKSYPCLFDNTWITNDERDDASVLRNNNLFVIPHLRIEIFKCSPLTLFHAALGLLA
jgi:hypothetical protein